MIEFDNVSFAYNEKFLMEGFNHRVVKGGTYCYYWESGAGKSTLLCSLMGLIALPGTMIGQIIGESSPDLSIRYQIMIMVINLSASILSVLISLQLSMRYTFDKYGRLKKSITDK